MAKQGELFVLDMGEPVRIQSLAETLIRRRGLDPYKDIPIEEIGLRPGEKLFEELLCDPTAQRRTACEQIFVERGEIFGEEEIAEKLSYLRDAADTENRETARQALMRAVPEYGRMAEKTSACPAG